MSKLASVRLAPAPDGGKYLLNIQLAATGHLVSGAEGAAGAEGTAAAARVERLERLDAGKQAGSGAPSLRPKGPSLRPAGPLAPPSPKRTGSGAPAAHSSGKVVAKLGTYKYTKPQLIEIGKSRGAQGKVHVDPIFAMKAMPPAALTSPFVTDASKPTAPVAKAAKPGFEAPRTREWQQQPPAPLKGKGGKVEGPPQPLRAHIGGFDRMPGRAEREADAARPPSATATGGGSALPKASSSKAALLQQQLAQGNNADVTQAINQHQVTQEKRAEKKAEKNEARKEKQRQKNKEKAEKKEEERKAKQEKQEKQRREAEEENQKWLQRKVDQAAANKARLEHERQEAEKSRAAGSWRRGEDEPPPPTTFQARPAPGGILKKTGPGTGRTPPLDAQKAPDKSPSPQQLINSNGGPSGDFSLGSRGGFGEPTGAGDRDADWRGNSAGPTSKPRGTANDHLGSASGGKPGGSGEMGALAFLNSNFQQQAPPRQQPTVSAQLKQSTRLGGGFAAHGGSSSGAVKASGHTGTSRQQQPQQQKDSFQGNVGAPANIAPSVANFFASLQGGGGLDGAPAASGRPPTAPSQPAPFSNQLMGGGSTIKPATASGSQGSGDDSSMAPSVANFFASVAAAPGVQSAPKPAPANSSRASMAPSVANLFAMAEGKAVAQPADGTGLAPGGIPFGR